MKLEQQVCSLELAKRLKELGVKQESHFYWWRDAVEAHQPTEVRYLGRDAAEPPDYPEFAAFSVAELGKMLPYEINYPFKNGKRRSHNHSIRFGTYGTVADPFYCGYRQLSARDNPYERAATEADARAKMLIYLIENKVISLAPTA